MNGVYLRARASHRIFFVGSKPALARKLLETMLNVLDNVDGDQLPARVRVLSIMPNVDEANVVKNMLINEHKKIRLQP